MAAKDIVSIKKNDSITGVEKDDIAIIKKASDSTLSVYVLRINSLVEVDESQIVRIDPNLYGDSHSKKICNVCHKALPTSHFEKNQNGINNRTVRRPSCKDCRKVIDGENMTNEEKKKWLPLKPHLIEFECPICKKITIPGLTSKVVLNHDHSTGIASGWICDSCNTGLGRFKDDVEILKQAIAYIENANQHRT